MSSGAAWGMLTGKGRYGVVCRCDPYLSALEAFAKMPYTNQCYLYLYLMSNQCPLSFHNRPIASLLLFYFHSSGSVNMSFQPIFTINTYYALDIRYLCCNFLMPIVSFCTINWCPVLSTRLGDYSGTESWWMKWMNEWKCNDLKCVRKPTKSRLSLTHHANKSSRWAE